MGSDTLDELLGLIEDSNLKKGYYYARFIADKLKNSCDNPLLSYEGFIYRFTTSFLNLYKHAF